MRLRLSLRLRLTPTPLSFFPDVMEPDLPDHPDTQNENLQDIEAMLEALCGCAGKNPQPPQPQPQPPRESQEPQVDPEWSDFIDQQLQSGPVAAASVATAGDGAVREAADSDGGESERGSSSVLEPDMYGKVSTIKDLGFPIQQSLFANFQEYIARTNFGKPVDDHKETVLESEFVTSSVLQSRVSRSSKTGISERSLGRNLLEYACALLYGSAFLISCFLHGFCQLINKKKYEPVLTISKYKYDETPLRMRVAEYQEFFQRDVGPGEAGGAVISKSAGESSTEGYLHAKILRIQWNYSPFAWFCKFSFVGMLRFYYTIMSGFKE